MDFPRFFYSPLRPQTTIAIDQVKTTSRETQPSVKISMTLLLNLFTEQLYYLSYFQIDAPYG